MIKAFQLTLDNKTQVHTLSHVITYDNANDFNEAKTNHEYHGEFIEDDKSYYLYLLDHRTLTNLQSFDISNREMLSVLFKEAEEYESRDTKGYFDMDRTPKTGNPPAGS